MEIDEQSFPFSFSLSYASGLRVSGQGQRYENTTRKKTFEVIICSAEGAVVLPKGSPRNVTFWSSRQRAWEAPRDMWKPPSWFGKTSELLAGALIQGCSPLRDFICPQPINGSHLFEIWAGGTTTFNFRNLRGQMLKCSFRMYPGISCSPIQELRQSYVTTWMTGLGKWWFHG